MSPNPTPEITPGRSEPAQGESEARDPYEVIDIYLADSLDNIATIHRILARKPRPHGTWLTAALNEARAHLENAQVLLAAQEEPHV